MDEKHSDQLQPLLTGKLIPVWDVESMKGNKSVWRPRFPTLPKWFNSFLILLLGVMSILLLLGRVLPWVMISVGYQKYSHQPHITQLTKLSPALVPAIKNDRRLIITGDVHGCKEELEDLLKHIHFNRSSDHLILAGDMINKGPDSHGVIKLARDLGASCVRGNHEDNFLALQGKLDTSIHSKAAKKQVEADLLASELSNKDIEWLRRCPLILEIGKIPSVPHAASVVVAHAGLVPGIPLLKQDPFAVMHMRSISKRHKSFQPNEGRDEGAPWWKVWGHEQDLVYRDSPKETMVVVYGHDSRTGLNLKKWSLGLDSGCVGGGRLSGVVIDNTNTKIQSIKCSNERE